MQEKTYHEQLLSAVNSVKSSKGNEEVAEMCVMKVDSENSVNLQMKSLIA